MTEHYEPGSAVTQPPDGYVYAGPVIRLIALIVDSVLFTVLLVALAIGYGLVRDTVAPPDGNGSSGSSTGSAGIALWVAAAVLTVAWYAVWQSASGSSPGMKVLKLRVTGPNLVGNPTFAAAFIRNTPLALTSLSQMGDHAIGGVLRLVPIVVYAAVGLSIARSADHQGIHDRFAGGPTYFSR